jgi:hypothetical protein
MIDFTDEICYDTKACADEEEIFHDFEKYREKRAQ